jgi:hypothetical protein
MAHHVVRNWMRQLIGVQLGPGLVMLGCAWSWSRVIPGGVAGMSS